MTGLLTSPGSIRFNIGARRSSENPFMTSCIVTTRRPLVSTFLIGMLEFILHSPDKFSILNVMIDSAQNAINVSAVNNAELANMTNASHPNIAANAIKAANNQIGLADNAGAANEVANAAIREAADVAKNSTSSAAEAAARVAAAAMNSANSLALGESGASRVANAAVNAAKAVNVKSDPNNAALKVANAAIAASNAVENAAVAETVKQNNQLNNSIAHANVTRAAKNLSSSNSANVRGYNAALNRKPANVAKGAKGQTITSNGKVRNAGANSLNMRPPRPAMIPANKGNTKTNRRVYKGGLLRNVYENKNGKRYTISTGELGNMKNYLFTGMMV